MSVSTIFMMILFLGAFAYFVTRHRSLVISNGKRKNLHSLPRHYGYYAATCAVLPGIGVLVLWLLFGGMVIDSLVISGLTNSQNGGSGLDAQLLINRIKMVMDSARHVETDPAIIQAAERYENLVNLGRYGAMSFAMALGGIGLYVAYSRTRRNFHARSKYEQIFTVLLAASAAIAIFVTLGIVLSLLFESLRFFSQVPLFDFLTGTHWSPQTGMRTDQVAAAGTFGAVPLFTGTAIISLIALFVAVPIGLMSAIYMTQYASRRVRKFSKPLLEILAGVPTVVYGFFAALVVAPMFTGLGDMIGLPIASHSALAAGTVMGIMIIPFISSMADDAITAVPLSLKEGSLALGATPSETIRRVILPAATPGLVGAILLAISRAIGETMIVVMAAGMQANMTLNPTESMTTVTVQIVKLLTGDQEFDSAKTLAAFALGLVLFTATLLLNIYAQKAVRRYQKSSI